MKGLNLNLIFTNKEIFNMLQEEAIYDASHFTESTADNFLTFLEQPDNYKELEHELENVVRTLAYRFTEEINDEDLYNNDDLGYELERQKEIDFSL